MKRTPYAQLDSFTRAYFQALVFTELPERRFRHPGDMRHWFDFEREGWNKIRAQDQAKIMEDCEDFQALAPKDIDPDDAGRDFAYTRNGHGCGFWDGDWPDELGEELTDLSKVFPECGLDWYKGRIYLR